jgi:spermidine synthase
VSRVRTSAPDSDPEAKWQLTHGVIVHGNQYRAPALRTRLTTYYGEPSGIGRAIRALRAERHGASLRIGVLGLGVGTLSAYGRPGDTVRIYELNPDVVRVARSSFSYLSDSRAAVELALGDARLVMEQEPPRNLDVLAVDAFSSDAIPVHLITREAAAVWARHVSPQGVIAYHISNRYLDLKPVVADLAQSLGRHAVIVDDDSEGAMPWLYTSTWVLITANEALIDSLSHAGQTLSPTAGFRPWTDDYYNLLSVLN